jgi:hypothetical protein
MKKTGMIAIIFLSLQCLHAQGLSNFFSQKEADIKWLLKQIALLQVYIGEVKTGYGVVKKGLTLIGDIKKGELNLHSNFFNSLKNVNPEIAAYSKIAAIISLNSAIKKGFKKALNNGTHFSSGEIAYLNKVYYQLSKECTENLNELLAITSNMVFEMSDVERIWRIDGIYADMKDKYAFTQSFTNEAALLCGQRENEQNEIEFLKKLP